MNHQLGFLNNIFSEMDQEINGQMYEKETTETGVVYAIHDMRNNKMYIGRAKSFTIKGDRHGAKRRFSDHWSNKSSSNQRAANDCPVFYEALRNSQVDDWFVLTLIVCPLDDIKDRETEMIELYKTGDSNFGYNYFVGNNQPNGAEHLATYKANKAMTNARRAEGGKLKRTEENRKLPEYISYYPVEENGKLVREGYMAQIKINGKIYKKVFISMSMSMKSKLQYAIEYIESVKKNAETPANIPKGRVRSKTNQNLPNGIRYYEMKKNGKVMSKGYAIEFCVNGKRYKKVFISNSESMELKLSKAKKQLKVFKKDIAKNKKKKSGSKTSKKLIK